MNYLMRNIQIFVINDDIVFSCDNKTSILDASQEIPFSNKQEVTFVDFVRDNGNSTYYSTQFIPGVIDFLNGTKPKSAIAKRLMSSYNHFKYESYGLAEFFNHCQKATISHDDLFSLRNDILKGYDRKKAITKISNSLGTDDYSEISKRSINLEWKQVNKEREEKQRYSRKNLGDDRSL